MGKMPMPRGTGFQPVVGQCGALTLEFLHFVVAWPSRFLVSGKKKIGLLFLY
jgi:hypothetical protein